MDQRHSRDDHAHLAVASRGALRGASRGASRRPDDMRPASYGGYRDDALCVVLVRRHRGRQVLGSQGARKSLLISRLANGSFPQVCAGATGQAGEQSRRGSLRRIPSTLSRVVRHRSSRLSRMPRSRFRKHQCQSSSLRRPPRCTALFIRVQKTPRDETRRFFSLPLSFSLSTPLTLLPSWSLSLSLYVFLSFFS